MFASKPAYFFTTSAALLSLCRGSGSSQVGSSLHTSIIGHNTSSHLLHSQRHASIYQRLHSLTEFKLANYHADNRNKFTSKEATGGPQQGFGFDPVSSALNLERATGRLKRRHNTNPEDYLDVDETARWIDARQAAKILNIKEADLPKLTKAVLEEKWRAAYRERNFAKQEEVLIATETLLEYIDSSLHHKKSRQYYRQLIENTRMAIDAEMEEQRRSRSAITIWSVSIFFFGASIMVMFVAVSRRYVTWDDANLIGNRVSEYVNMTFMQPKNLEPKPDYHTRYFNTPTAMELDRRAGRADQQFMPVEEVRILDDKATFERKEEAEMLQLLNEENELAAAHGRVDAAAQSRVAVYRPEDLEEGDSAKASTSTTTDASLSVSRPSSTKDEPRSANNFRGFVSMMSNNFGGGSHFQRLTQETAQRSAEAEKLAERSTRQKKMSESAHGSESDASN